MSYEAKPCMTGATFIFFLVMSSIYKTLDGTNLLAAP